MYDVYCGPAPTPGTLISAWNPDIVAFALCLGIAFSWLRLGNARRAHVSGAIVVLVVLFMSPLCALTAALFSARALHHVLLVAVAAPLLALSFPADERPGRIGIGWVAVLHGAIFWFWHAPPIYPSAVADPIFYWIMQLSLLGSGFWFWRRVLNPLESGLQAVFALLATTVQMGMLGALLTFATVQLYEPHFLTTLPFGLSPIQDQQLAGILMWVPAAVPYLVAALLRTMPLLDSRRSAPWSG